MPGLIAHWGWIVCANWEMHNPEAKQTAILTNQTEQTQGVGIGSLEAAALEAQ